MCIILSNEAYWNNWWQPFTDFSGMDCPLLKVKTCAMLCEYDAQEWWYNGVFFLIMKIWRRSVCYNLTNSKLGWYDHVFTLWNDCRGVIGSPMNEIWAFVIDIERDIPFIAQYFNFRTQDVFNWYFVHVILAACWNLEDNIDASLFLRLAEKAYKYVS